MADNKKASYRNIMLSTVVFGGAQGMVMLLNVLRGKFVALILGAAGMGLSSLLGNAANCIQQIALMGINQSGVRDVSKAESGKDKAQLYMVSRIVRTMILASAMIGMFGAVAFSPFITHISVDNMDYLIHFALLGAVVLFNILGLGEYTNTQYKSIAYSTVVTQVCGLLLGIPVYYKWGTAGIVPAMILQSLVYYVAVRYLVCKNVLKRQALPRVSLYETWQRGKEMIMLGVVLMMVTLLGTLTTYAMSAFISNTGSMADLGFYQAANMITMQCSGLVFSAMATDYYPKLAGIIGNDMPAAHRLVNQQMEIVLLVIVPVSMIIVSVAPLLISLLLTEEFQVMQRMMRFMGYAVIFKAVCFPADYMSYAKGDKRYFFWVEGILVNVKTLLVFVLFYYCFGLDGLGYAALFSSLIDVFITMTLNRWRYGFLLSSTVMSMFVRLTLMATACLLFSFVNSVFASYALTGIVTLLCCVYSYRQLDMRIDIKFIIKSKIK